MSIKLFPNGTLSYTNRGRAYEMKGDLKRAIADFGVAISHDRENPSAYINRAVAARTDGRSQRRHCGFEKRVGGQAPQGQVRE